MNCENTPNRRNSPPRTSAINTRTKSTSLTRHPITGNNVRGPSAVGSARTSSTLSRARSSAMPASRSARDGASGGGLRILQSWRELPQTGTRRFGTTRLRRPGLRPARLAGGHRRRVRGWWRRVPSRCLPELGSALLCIPASSSQSPGLWLAAEIADLSVGAGIALAQVALRRSACGTTQYHAAHVAVCSVCVSRLGPRQSLRDNSRESCCSGMWSR